ncbi:hypothetical protein OF83DRAFT_1027578, partial [Amylostereum chailletii]
RPLTIVYEHLDRVDGSARFGFGSDTALASLSGPIEVRLASEHPSKATLEVLVRPLANVPGTASKALAHTLRALLAPALLLARHPRALVQIVVQACAPSRGGGGGGQAPPALVAACINAAALALLDGVAVPMAGVVCAAAVAKLPSGAFVVDPGEAEAMGAAGVGCFAFLFAEGGEGAGVVGKAVWTDWRAHGGA